ncbi:hypothetical protein [Microbulbifer sp. TYP-18]|uniref:hypothetical protein n=1 Tax=Microbulbifer sp. TYP-18 TaxID=3230024 RepID=UPI0034C5ED73
MLNKTRLSLFLSSMIVCFIVMRTYLYFSPGTNLDIGPYNIHHLYTGLVLMVIACVPLIILQGYDKLLNFATILFGIGLCLALDEWVYLIATGGSDAEYLLPVSFWGAVVVIGLTCIYTLFVSYLAKSKV